MSRLAPGVCHRAASAQVLVSAVTETVYCRASAQIGSAGQAARLTSEGPGQPACTSHRTARCPAAMQSPDMCTLGRTGATSRPIAAVGLHNCPGQGVFPSTLTHTVSTDAVLLLPAGQPGWGAVLPEPDKCTERSRHPGVCDTLSLGPPAGTAGGSPVVHA